MPTEKGYRYFVQQLLNDERPLYREMDIIQSRFADKPLDMDSWMQTATVILAQETQSAALVTNPSYLHTTSLKKYSTYWCPRAFSFDGFGT